MPKSPSSGSRSTPRVAKGESPSFNNDSMGGYDGVRGTKAPSGNRPVPTVARNHPPTATTPGKVKKAIKHTPMGAPKRDANRALKGRAGGGGSY
jgi:hypothetical protein